MKNTAILLIVLIFALNSNAQIPEKMSYQAVIRNNSNQLVVNQSIGMQVTILKTSVNGTAVFIERHFSTTNANGLVSLEIGSGTLVSGSFNNIDWSEGPYFLKTEIDLDGGANYTIVGTNQLLSVPYAFHTNTANEVLNEYDPIFDESSAKGITNNLINNWNLAFGWGNHSGLYRPGSWVPDWTSVTGKPDFASVATSGSYNDLMNKPTILNSQWTNNEDNIYYNGGNVGIGIENPAYKLDVLGNRIRLIDTDDEWISLCTDGYSGNSPFLHILFSGTGLVLRGSEDGQNIILNPDRQSKVGIRTWAPAYDLDVRGNIRATGSVFYGGTSGNADGTAYSKPDFVFCDNYNEMSTDEVEEFLLREKHLPWVTSAKKEKEENGDVTDMTRMAFETLEALENQQLQLIRLKNENDYLKKQLKEMNSQFEEFKKIIIALNYK